MQEVGFDEVGVEGLIDSVAAFAICVGEGGEKKERCEEDGDEERG